MSHYWKEVTDHRITKTLGNDKMHSWHLSDQRSSGYKIWPKNQLILGLEQSCVDKWVRNKQMTVISSHLACGKWEFPPSLPPAAVALCRMWSWLHWLEPTTTKSGEWHFDPGRHVYSTTSPGLHRLLPVEKVQRPKVSNKRLKEEKWNKSKRK